MTSKNN